MDIKKQLKEFKWIDILLILIILLLFLQARQYREAYAKCLDENNALNLFYKFPNITLNAKQLNLTIPNDIYNISK